MILFFNKVIFEVVGRSEETKPYRLFTSPFLDKILFFALLDFSPLALSGVVVRLPRVLTGVLGSNSYNIN